MIIRKAEERDVDKILDLLEDVLYIHASGRPDIFKENGSKYTREQVQFILSCPKTPVFVADENGVVGYAFCEVKDSESSGALKAVKSLYVDDLCVDKTERGKGVGKKLYEHVLDYAKKCECYHLTLNVWELNKGAKAFYEKLGLTALKTTMEKVID